MEAKNQLISYEKEAGGKTRRYYRITGEGMKELEQRKKEWETYSGAVAQIMAAFGRLRKGGSLWERLLGEDEGETGGELYGV